MKVHWRYFNKTSHIGNPKQENMESILNEFYLNGNLVEKIQSEFNINIVKRHLR